jgi:ectoine hydroxylase-related dioxygenase (phytanoyl-CoA dioxygenase family)
LEATLQGQALRYKIRNHDLENPFREIDVHAAPEELQQFARDGYLVRHDVLSPAQLQRMRDAVDEIAAQDARQEVGNSRRFGGHFLRHLLDKHEAFHDLIHFPPLLSVARAMLGPQIQIRGLTARISFPDQPNQETHWHFHQRLIPDPQPPFFSRPHTIDCLIYLNDADEANGPLCVVPGSHQWIERDLPDNDWSDKPGQQTLRVPAGTAVMCHGALWHRALPTTPEGAVRRLLILGYGACWLRPSIYGDKPENGLTQKLLENADAETRELLGAGGWM